MVKFLAMAVTMIEKNQLFYLLSFGSYFGVYLSLRSIDKHAYARLIIKLSFMQYEQKVL